MQFLVATRAIRLVLTVGIFAWCLPRRNARTTLRCRLAGERAGRLVETGPGIHLCFNIDTSQRVPLAGRFDHLFAAVSSLCDR